jgi:PAS domain S-box-containing protein
MQQPDSILARLESEKATGSEGHVVDLHTGTAPWQLIDALPAAIYVTDRAGHITYFNEAAARLWGCRPKLGSDQWCGSWRLYSLDGTPMPHDQCPMAITLRQGSPVRGGTAIAERPDGTRVPFMAFPTRLRGSSGTLIGAVNMLIDISDAQRAERLEHRLAAIVESSDDAIISTDVKGVITTWNNAAERLFGYSEAEAIGRPLTILYPPDRQKEIERLERIRLRERIDHFETVRQRKDGSLVNVSLTVSPISELGRIVGVSGIVRDITERKRTEDALRASEAELQAVLNQTPFMLVRCSRDLRYRFVSQAYAQWIDRPREEVLGATIAETIGARTFNTVRPYIEQVLQGVPVDFECEREFPGIGRRCLKVAYRPELDNGGNVDGWIASLLDVTERKRAEQRQVLLLAELDHRVKNILAEVAVVASSTRQGSRSIRDFVRSLDGRIQSMAAAHSLLSESGWQNVGLATLVRNQLAPYATRTNVTIGETDVVVNPAETQAVARVVHELTTNAAKYGALSSRGGQVSVNWDLKPNGSATNLILVWRESGGPPVPAERPSSYGTNLIRNLIPHELGGTVDLVFAAEGVNCRIEIPIKRT